MRKVSLKNKNLITLLSNITEYLNNNEVIAHLNKFSTRDNSRINDHKSLSMEYLNQAFTDPKNYCFPQNAFGVGIKNYKQSQSDDVLHEEIKIFSHLSAVKDFLGANHNALAMYYPPGGFIDWHHNGNASGYNILFTYNQTGDGEFMYWDYDTESVISMPDDKGWSAKAGYYAPLKEPTDRVYWHAAKTKSPRLTIAFIIDHKLLWEDMLDEIESED